MCRLVGDLASMLGWVEGPNEVGRWFVHVRRRWQDDRTICGVLVVVRGVLAGCH